MARLPTGFRPSFPEPTNRDVDGGVKGGHHTIELTNLADATNKFQIVEMGAAKAHGGTTYHRFQQWAWRGNAAAKPKRGAPDAPGGAQFDVSQWKSIADPKTTFDDPAAFITDAELGYNKWLEDNARVVPAADRISFTTPGGVAVTCYIDVNSGPDYKVRSIFPDGSWIP